MKQGLNSCDCFGLRFFGGIVRSEVMQISVFVALSAGSAAVAQPSGGKSLPTPPRNERLEGRNGDLKGVETGIKERVDAFRPPGDVRKN